MNQMIAEIKKSKEVLEQGGLILYPTDTIWGVGCDASNPEAIAKVYQLKQRDDAKSLIVLLAEAKDIFQYVANPHPDIISLIKGFDTPTTIVYDQAIGLPDNLVNADGSIAIRITRDPFCKMLIKTLKKPLVSTSANVSGQPSAQSFSEIAQRIKDGVDYIVDHRRTEVENGTASRILRIKSDGNIEVIRG